MSTGVSDANSTVMYCNAHVSHAPIACLPVYTTKGKQPVCTARGSKGSTALFFRSNKFNANGCGKDNA